MSPKPIVLVLAASLTALLLAGCASTTAPPTAGRTTSPAPTVPQAAPPVLAAEKHWLEELFRDTPVTVSAAPDAGVRVEVPLKYAFDTGKDAVKPPLAAVLDKVAVSLHRQPRAQLRVSAPAGVRAENVRREMLKRGVPASRIAPLVARGDAVELQLWVPSPA
jgi:outer membrane protein OmpA-like peptidoglycan-associated protein